jgi:hypothetical protein
MDLVELRILAVGGILAVGVIASALAVTGVAVAGWIGRLWQDRPSGGVRTTAVGQRSHLGAGRARC